MQRDIQLLHLIPVDDPAVPLPLGNWFTPDQPVELEIGCGNGRFLACRAKQNPGVGYIGIERMLDRVRKVESKAQHNGLDNLRVLRLEAFYTFYYLLPPHRLRAVYVFFPDPWPKLRHHSHRLFTPLFLDALWERLAIGGEVQIATDHLPYFDEIQSIFAADKRFEPVPAMTRGPDEQTDFEMLFLKQGLPIGSAGYRTLPAPEKPLPPLVIPPENLPKGRKEPCENPPPASPSPVAS